VTLFFSRGALAFPRDGMGTVARIGDTETVRERGCLSTRGLTFNLHVGDVVLRPGETRQVGSWTIRYDGAVRFVEDTGCAIDADTVRWFATSTELRYACEPPQVPGSQCSAEIEEADRRGREHNFGPGVEAGTYEVVTVGATGFGLRAAGSDQGEFAWPEALGPSRSSWATRSWSSRRTAGPCSACRAARSPSRDDGGVSSFPRRTSVPMARSRSSPSSPVRWRPPRPRWGWPSARTRRRCAFFRA